MIAIYGHSDDCIEVTGPHQGDTEFYPPMDEPLSLVVHDPKSAQCVVVTCQYGVGDAGVWRIAVEPYDEDKPMPTMAITLADNGYSPRLAIDCSASTTVGRKGGAR